LATRNEPSTVRHLTDLLHSADRVKEHFTARDLMRACAATLRPEDSVELAARLINESGTDGVPVVDISGRLIGIISDRDITMKVVARGRSISKTQVSDCMSHEAFACSADNSIESCVSAMLWHQLSRITIVDYEHRVVGTISQKDLACYLCEYTESLERRVMNDILWALAN
jgi:predicted transcriptional regulator